MKKFIPPNRYASPYPMTHTVDPRQSLIPAGLIPLSRPGPDTPTRVEFILHTAHTSVVVKGFELPKKEPIPLYVLKKLIQHWIDARDTPLYTRLHFNGDVWLAHTLHRYDLIDEADYTTIGRQMNIAGTMRQWINTQRPFDILIEIFDGDVHHPAARTAVDAASQSLHDYLTGLWLRKAEARAHTAAENYAQTYYLMDAFGVTTTYYSGRTPLGGKVGP